MAIDENDDTPSDESETAEKEPRFTVVRTDNLPAPESREQYLDDPDVRGFTVFLAGLLGDGGALRHAWHHAKYDYDWQCRDLLDAAWRYRFLVHGSFRHITGQIDRESLRANALVLSNLETRLWQAIVKKDDAEAQSAAKEIQIWGGTNRGNHNRSAITALGASPGGFIDYLEKCHKAFGAGAGLDLKPFLGATPGLRSNAGFTKIYALAFDDFAIYDSRVAAAVGLLIVRWWALTCHAKSVVSPLPQPLRFLCMPEYSNSRRNPNDNVFDITGFPVNSAMPGHLVHFKHLQSNVRCNWILSRALHGTFFAQEVLSRPHPFRVTALRALEAALFMIGYSLAGNWPHRS